MASRRAGIPPSDLARALGEISGANRPDPLDEESKRLLASLRERFPHLFPGRPFGPGESGPEIPLGGAAGAALYRLVAQRIVGLPSASPDAPQELVWTQGDDELVVDVGAVKVTTAPGAVAVDVPVRCDQVGSATVRVRFALGSDERPAGLIAATDERPFGPPEIVDVWGDALTAFAWQLVVTTAAHVAGATGQDGEGSGLIPVAIRSTEAGLVVQTMARHAFDRTGPS
jgi:hypothetical protein